MMIPPTHSRAFTLIETIVVVGLTAFMMIALGQLIRYFYQTNTYVLEQSKAVDSARRSIENAMTDIREASYGADGSYPLLSAATSSVTFYADIANNSSVEKVRYYLSGTSLYRGVTDPGGNPPSYGGQTEKTTLVVDNIRNGTTALFRYYDTAGNELTEPITVSAVASVRITVLTDVNPERAPNVYTLSGGATLRNLHNLYAL